MIDTITSLNWHGILTIIGVIAGVYVAVAIILGLTKGWGSVKTMWFYTKKLWYVLAALVALIIIAYGMKGRNQRKNELDDRIGEITNIENKTEEHKKELKRLEDEKKEVENEIIDITKKYKEKVEKLKQKPQSSAANSSDALNDVWR